MGYTFYIEVGVPGFPLSSPLPLTTIGHVPPHPPPAPMHGYSIGVPSGLSVVYIMHSDLFVELLT